MPREIYLVKVGMTMTEGVVDEWYIADGGAVNKGDLLYRLETEKVQLEVDAEADGIVRHLVPAGVTCEPGDVVGYIYAAGEEIPDVLPQPAGAAAAAPVAAADASPASAPATVTRAPGERVRASPAARRLARELGVDYTLLAGTGPGGRIVEADVQAAHDAGGVPAAAAAGDAPRASPLAKRLAAQYALDLASIRGTGPGGRITREDVENAAARAGVPPEGGAPARAAASAGAAGPAAGDTIALRGMRKTIANRMYESLQNMAQLTMDMDVDMDAAVSLRTELVRQWEADGVRPSYTDMVVRAVARALTEHPLMNARFGETEIALLDEVNVGMAVAVPDGLVVPVIRGADELSLAGISREAGRLAAAARDGRLTMDDFADGTFTVSALGQFGVDSFTPIINAPQAGILGVNRLRDDVAWDGDTPVRCKRMRLSLTWDHRVLDGAPAAQFLAGVRDLLENPLRLLL